MALLASGLAAVALGAALYFALIERLPLEPAPRARAAMPEALDRSLRCDPGLPLAVTLEAEVATGGGATAVVRGRTAFRLPGSSLTREVGFQLYRATGVTRPAPAVVITPVLDGDCDVEEYVAADLAAHGFHAVIVDRGFPDPLTLERTEEASREVIVARRRVIDWLVTRPDVDARRIGAFGVSMGGIVTTVLAEVEPRISAAVVVMAGGDFASCIAHSAEDFAFEMRAGYGCPREATAEQVDAFEARARAVLKTCPLVLAPYADPRTIFFISTRRDESVPTDTQVRLREALGRPEGRSIPTGHYSAVVYGLSVMAWTREFLGRRLCEESREAASPP